MKTGLATKLFLTSIVLITTVLAGCSLSTDNVNITKKESGASIKQVKLDVNDADLIIKESMDSNVHANLSGLKASEDEAVLTTSVKDSVLEVKAAYIEGSYIDLNKETINDQTGVKLTLSLPKKQYEKIQVNLPDSGSKLEVLVKEKLENITSKTTKVDSLFGTIHINR
jgi:outer membrane murein-binding lipoprotein Lpp